MYLRRFSLLGLSLQWRHDNGGLWSVLVRLQYSDGSRTDGYVNPNSSVTARRALTFCELTPKEKMHRRY